LRNKERRKERRKLAKGPERAVKARSFLGFKKLKGFIGTGFPQPKPASKIQTVPMGSKWERGFRVNLPSSLAVGSPSLKAERAWANS